MNVLPQFKHVNRWSFHIYFKHKRNMNKHQKVFWFNRRTHHFSSFCPPKLNLSPVWFVVKAKMETAAATGHAHLHGFRADNITRNRFFFFKYIAPYFHHFRAVILNSGSRDPLSCRVSLQPWSNSPTFDFLMILKTFISMLRCVWLGLELNSAGKWISRARLGHPYFRLSQWPSFCIKVPVIV